MSADETADQTTDRTAAGTTDTSAEVPSQVPAEPTLQPTTSDRLVGVVTAVPGVSGIEPGIATTVGAIDARLRRSPDRYARYGLVVDADTGTATVEIALDGTRPVREVVADVQRAVAAAVAEVGVLDEPLQVHVRVQSVTTPGITHG